MNWQSIDTAPRDGSYLWLYEPNGTIWRGRWLRDEWTFGVVSDDRQVCTLTRRVVGMIDLIVPAMSLCIGMLMLDRSRALRDEGYRESSINFAGAAAILFVVTIIGCVLDLDVLT